MKNSTLWPSAIGAVALATASVNTAIADDIGGNKPVRADTHAPIGVMADHTHNAGEWMLSYRLMRMEMNGNKIGSKSVSPDFIVNNIANPFGAMPATLRVVPTKMTMDMHMLGAMYAPTDRWTLMAMVNYLDNTMDHITYSGMGPGVPTPAVVGGFTTTSSGLGDTTLGALFRLRNEANEKWHLNLALSAPTGSIKEKDQVLAPNGMRPTLRLPYTMQLGSGTWDLKPGVTYNGRRNNLTWGVQYIGTIRTGTNDEGYTLGNRQDLTGWLAFSPRPSLSFSARMAYQDIDSIDGMDPQIMAPVQTANPENYGGKTTVGYLGLNLAGQESWRRGHRVAIELGTPFSQDLNGPQMKLDKTLTFGWQYAF